MPPTPLPEWKQRPSLLHDVTDAIATLPVTDWFSNEQALELELGCGDGSFLVRHAAEHTDRNFIGVERLKGRVTKLDRKARRAGLTNIALLRFEASYLVRYLLPKKAFGAIHVYFPDPWPKKRHRAHRLIQTPFIRDAEQLLQAGGFFHLRTDDLDYFEQMLEVFSDNPHYEAVVTPADLLALRTDFETEFNERGIATNHATYRLVGG